MVKSILKMTDEERRDFWKDRRKDGEKLMSINVSPWHMAIFPEFHKDMTEIESKILHEKADPADPIDYSFVRVVFDLDSDQIVYNRYS